MARRQSAAIYFRGTRHKEIYYQGHYHDELWLNGQCLWKKLSGGFPSSVVSAALSGYGSVGKIGDTVYSLACTRDRSEGTVTMIMTPWTNGSAGNPISLTINSSDYFYPANRAAGMMIAARELYRGTSASNPAIYVSLDGVTFTGYELPTWSASDYPRPNFAPRGNFADLGVIGDKILLPGGRSYSKQFSHFLIDTSDGSSVSKDSSGSRYSFTYYSGFYNDTYSGALLGHRVSAGYRSSSVLQVTQIDLAQIASVASDGTLVESTVCTFNDVSDDLTFLHAVNGLYFNRSGQKLYKLDTSTGVQNVVLTLSGSSDSFVGDVVFNGSKYLLLTWDGSTKAWVGFTSTDGETWTEDATVADGTSKTASGFGNSIYADSGLYTGGWNDLLVYAAE